MPNLDKHIICINSCSKVNIKQSNISSQFNPPEVLFIVS